MPDHDNPPPSDPVADVVNDQDDGKSSRSFAPLFAKGCGFVALCAVLGLGVVFGGDARIEAWGSAVMGVFFLLLVVSTSGLTGWWNK